MRHRKRCRARTASNCLLDMTSDTQRLVAIAQAMATLQAHSITRSNMHHPVTPSLTAVAMYNRQRQPVYMMNQAIRQMMNVTNTAATEINTHPVTYIIVRPVTPPHTLVAHIQVRTPDMVQATTATSPPLMLEHRRS